MSSQGSHRPQHIIARLAGSSARHPKRVIGLWVLVTLVGAFLAAAVLPNVLTTEADFTTQPEAKRTRALLESSGLEPERRAQELVIVRSDA